MSFHWVMPWLFFCLGMAAAVEKKCRFNMEYRDCGGPCVNTCTKPQLNKDCRGPCFSGCFCPKGMLLNNIDHNGCVPAEKCPCHYNREVYQPGEMFENKCKNCACENGQWMCTEKDFATACTVLGGSHFVTYDGKKYSYHGDCTYVLSKDERGFFTVFGSLHKCEKSPQSTCLTKVTLMLHSEKETPHAIEVDASGNVVFNKVATKLPINVDTVNVFRATNHSIVIAAARPHGLTLVTRHDPTMQVQIFIKCTLIGKLRGLCGDFNDDPKDDFKDKNGVIQTTAAAFAKSWRKNKKCVFARAKRDTQHLCSEDASKELYAKHLCSNLKSPSSVFSKCHDKVDPKGYYDTCLDRVCQCKDGENCMCIAYSAYITTCASMGIRLGDWNEACAE